MLRWPKYLEISYFLQISASHLRNYIYKNIGISMQEPLCFTILISEVNDQS